MATLSPQPSGSSEIEHGADSLTMQMLSGLPMQCQSPGQARTLTETSVPPVLETPWVSDSERLGSNPAFAPCQSTSRPPAVLVSRQPPNHRLVRQPWAAVPAHECISSSCPACRQVGRQGRRDPRRGTAARNPSYFSESDHVLKQRCESFFLLTLPKPQLHLHPTPYLISVGHSLSSASEPWFRPGWVTRVLSFSFQVPHGADTQSGLKTTVLHTLSSPFDCAGFRIRKLKFWLSTLNCDLL